MKKDIKIAVFGVKDSTETIVKYIEKEICHISAVITINQGVNSRNHISGYKAMDYLEDLKIQKYEAQDYYLEDEDTVKYFEENKFDLGIVVGWQRRIPKHVLEAFKTGVFGFHGNCGYLPFGRGRSPLNWSVILGDTRFNTNLFKYDEELDSPNVFATEMFSITPHDDIKTLGYKQSLCNKKLIKKLIFAAMEGTVEINTASKDYDSWYGKRTPADGKIDFKGRTRDIYNLVRGVTAPFPGAFCYIKDIDAPHNDITMENYSLQPEKKVIIWEAKPFDEMLDFRKFAPGEVIDIFDNRPIIRTVDGSLIINKYEAGRQLQPGDILI